MRGNRTADASHWGCLPHLESRGMASLYSQGSQSKVMNFNQGAATNALRLLTNVQTTSRQDTQTYHCKALLTPGP